MFENMVCGVANVGERKYRILAVFIIAVMVSMSAFLMPVQVYAAGEAISVLVGTLAGLITESVAGSALAAAGCAALIPEFAGAFIAVAVGLGVTLTVYQLYQCFESWWGTSGNVSDFKMIAEAFDKQNNRIIASPFIFASIVSTIKSQILGIEDTSENAEANIFKNMTFYGTNTLVNDNLSVFKYKVNDNLSYQDVLEHRGFGLKHYVDIMSGNIFLRFSSDSGADFSFGYHGDVNKYLPNYPVVSSAYSPIFNSKECKIANHIVQNLPEGKVIECSDVKNANLISAGYYNSKGDYCNLKIEYHSESGEVCVPYDSKIYFLKLKDGKIIYKFKSINDFAYKLFYDSVGINCSWRGYIGRENELSFVPISSTVSKPVARPNILSNYNAKRDVISTTADDINKKIKTGDVTKDTAGSISIGMAPTAVGKLTNTSTAQDVKKVKITDVALPTQVEADKTAKEEAKIDPPGNIGAAFRQGGDMIIDGAMTISDKFPFDVIKCAYEWLQCLIQDGKPIVTEFTIKIPKIGSVPVKIDFSQRQDVVTVINWICIVGCGLGLILTSREWLKAI